uniref:Uncharacterized protein n=1 Tax=Yersinia enterocolitica W22703 TaxID=913028 RepID=F4MWA3_YEREN|nr:unknown protein [Yersinia enterocolitica W22703]
MALLKGFTLQIKNTKHQLILNIGIKSALPFFKEKIQ